MVDHAEFSRWRAAAEDARQAASVQGDAGGHNWACFLAEQSAQLAVKGLLHGIGAGPWGHDPVVLGAAVANNTGRPLPTNVEAALRRLSRHYIPPRYPDAHPSGPPALYYGSTDVDQALADLDLIHSFIDALWSELGGEDEPENEAGAE